MSNSGENDIWTAPQLAARLAALKGVAPAPTCHVIYRATMGAATGADQRDVSGYVLPGEAERRDEAFFGQWLRDRALAGVERLSVSVLVIRETLDAAGLVREGVLERRRGGVDGPPHGKAARVEFTGAAQCVRQYQALRDGRLVEVPMEQDADAQAVPDDPDAMGFAGEDAAVHAFLGGDALILDRRSPTLFEDMLGLSGIVHARRADGRVAGCGVGWHGTMAFVLAAAFPRMGARLLPPPGLAAAVEEAVRTRGLIAHETRLDERGFCVIAQEGGNQEGGGQEGGGQKERTLVALRWDGTGARIEAYVPGQVTGITEDQRRWISYAETYEARTILDSWHDADGDEIAVLTLDPDGEAWRHIVDSDGIEISRRSDNEAAAAVLYREQLRPPPMAEPPAQTPAREGAAPEQPAPADSLLTRLRAYGRVMALLRAAAAACAASGAPGGDQSGDQTGERTGDRASAGTAGGGKTSGDGVPRAALDPLRALPEPLAVLHAVFSAGSLHRLMRQAETGAMTAHAFATALEDLVTRLRDELALTRIVVLPSAPRPPDDEPPFGAMVEAHFPAAIYDIEEAVHCLALRRTTASVLHAMKVMRHGLRGIESLLKTPKLTELPWSRQIATVRAVPGAHRGLAEALTRVRRVWRAPGLMPADKYTEEEAEAVLEAVAVFMRALAAGFEARGEPPGD